MEFFFLLPHGSHWYAEYYPKELIDQWLIKDTIKMKTVVIEFQLNLAASCLQFNMKVSITVCMFTVKLSLFPFYF